MAPDSQKCHNSYWWWSSLFKSKPSAAAQRRSVSGYCRAEPVADCYGPIECKTSLSDWCLWCWQVDISSWCGLQPKTVDDIFHQYAEFLYMYIG